MPHIAVRAEVVLPIAGSVELQIRAVSPGDPTGTMSLEYHSRQPTFYTREALPGCDLLGGTACYPDGNTLGPETRFRVWFRARDGQAVIDELVRLHHVRWLREYDTTDAPARSEEAPVLTAEHVAAAQLRITLDDKLGRETPDAVRRIAQHPGTEVPPSS